VQAIAVIGVPRAMHARLPGEARDAPQGTPLS